MKLNECTLFEIKHYYEGDIDFIQKIYVFAKTSEEAIEKFEAYNKKQVKKGFCRMIMIDYPTVDCDYVIG